MLYKAIYTLMSKLYISALFLVSGSPPVVLPGLLATSVYLLPFQNARSINVRKVSLFAHSCL